MGTIDSVADLEGAVGKKPAALDLKVVDHIDPTSQLWLSYARAMLACVSTPNGPTIAIAGGHAGFASGQGETLMIPVADFDETEDLLVGSPFGSLWLVPGMGETLRLNGTIAELTGEHLTVQVQECYLHCAKAFIRSGFWTAQPGDAIPVEIEKFASSSSFMALGTVSKEGAADLSPKGDPSGRLVGLNENHLRFADRPGNRRTDSFRNILTNPRIAAALLRPGSNYVATVKGVASLNDDADVRGQFEIEVRVPKLIVEVGELALTMRRSEAIEKAQLWPTPPPPRELDAAKIFAAHMRLNKDRSVAAKLSKAIVSVPGLMRRGLESDYKKNLY